MDYKKHLLDLGKKANRGYLSITAFSIKIRTYSSPCCATQELE